MPLNIHVLHVVEDPATFGITKIAKANRKQSWNIVIWDVGDLHDVELEPLNFEGVAAMKTDRNMRESKQAADVGTKDRSMIGGQASDVRAEVEIRVGGVGGNLSICPNV